jgi:hypothetical protein
MEALITQAFAHVENLADWVAAGNYDLLGPEDDIIMPEYWRETIQPDMQVTMMLWPFPEKKEDDAEPIPLPIDEGDIINLDDILYPGGKKARKKTGSQPSGLAAWMLGGSPNSRRKKK